MNPQYKRKGKTRAEILKENPDAFKKLTKKEIKELRKNKKQLSKYALKEISERLKRIEDKFDNFLFFLEKPSTLNIKGFWSKPKKHSDGDYYEDYE